MPGLPRKSTANQFKKLMKKSGKSRTNKSAGGSDPSTRKIATYEQFVKYFEGIKWYSKGEFSDEIIPEFELKRKTKTGELVEIHSIDDVEVGDELYSLGDLFGYVFEIGGKIVINTTKDSKFILPHDKFLSYKFSKRG